MKWLKLHHSIRHSASLGRLTAAQMWGVVVLLIAASESKRRGVVEMEVEDLAHLMRCTPDEATMLLGVLERKGFVSRLDGGAIEILNWQMYQVEDPTAARRNREYRERQKAKTVNKTIEESSENGTVTRNVTPVTRLDIDIDIDIDTISSLRSEIEREQAPAVKKQKADTGYDWLHDPELVAAENLGPPEWVEHQRQIACDWLAATGKRYKDYKAFFRNWLKRAQTDGNRNNTGAAPKTNSRGHSTADGLADALRRFDGGLNPSP